MNIISASAAAKMLKVSKMTVYRMVHEGKLPSAGKISEPNGAFVFREEDVNALVRERERKRSNG